MALLQTLTDDFATQNATLWIYGTNTSATGGRCVIVSTSSYPTVASQTTYDLTGSYMLVQIPQVYNVGTPSIGLFLELRMASSSANLVRWDWSNSNQMTAVRTVAGSTTVVGTAVGYTAGMWVRIRESGGTIFWDTSTNGTAWTNTGSWVWTFAAITSAHGF